MILWISEHLSSSLDILNKRTSDESEFQCSYTFCVQCNKTKKRVSNESKTAVMELNGNGQQRWKQKPKETEMNCCCCSFGISMIFEKFRNQKWIKMHFILLTYFNVFYVCSLYFIYLWIHCGLIERKGIETVMDFINDPMFHMKFFDEYCWSQKNLNHTSQWVRQQWFQHMACKWLDKRNLSECQQPRYRMCVSVQTKFMHI